MRISMRLVPVGAGADLDLERDAQLGRAHHARAQTVTQFVDDVGAHFEDQLVVHLQQHPCIVTLAEPDLFFDAPGYEGSALVLLRLPAVGVARLRELVTDAWRMRAPDQAGTT